jgi:UDP-N-acetylmuramoyl-tripeptide--D-alanyl-D-alanine ligase
MLERALWLVDELEAAIKGTLHGKITRALNGVSIDSRTISEGDIFVAIRGDKMDGHDYVAKALAAGAGVAIVNRVDDAMLKAGPVIQVSDDPLDALERMGVAARARSRAKIIAVTGSVGKTSTKEMLRTALEACGMTHASAASFNNHWGVPLTLARLHPQASYGIFEIGMNHAGEITPLVKMVAPHLAIITSIAASHLGNFASLDEIAAAKAEIFSGVVVGGHAIINQDTPYYSMLRRAAEAHGVSNISGFGENAASDFKLVQLALHDHCCCVTADLKGEPVSYRLGLAGKHMALNSLAVLAAVKLAGADVARAMLALATAEPPKGRGVRNKLSLPQGAFTLLDESYNANPESMRAALELLANMKPGRRGKRIVIVGDMLELGDHAQSLHAGLAVLMEKNAVDTVHAAGPMMAHMFNQLSVKRRGTYAPAASELIASLGGFGDGDIVMVKGSNGSRMGQVVEHLRKTYVPVLGES